MPSRQCVVPAVRLENSAEGKGQGAPVEKFFFAAAHVMYTLPMNLCGLFLLPFPVSHLLGGRSFIQGHSSLFKRVLQQI